MNAIIEACTTQAGFCRLLGSPFSAAVLEALAERAVTPGPVTRLFEPWRDADKDKLVADAMPLRFLGGLHHLVLTGAEPELAACYPAEPDPGDPAVAVARLDGVLARRERELADFARSPPQTNEIRRALCLFGGFLTVAGETGLPLSVLEIGASAGLLQSFDRFYYTAGGWTWGDADSSVVIPGEWRGSPPPLDASLRVASRRACDQAPVDIRDEGQALRLLAYVWPDQFDRLARTRAGITLAREADVTVERADAADWVAAHAQAEQGVATVLFHSVMWQYMPATTQAAVRAVIEGAGAAATPAAPFAWLRMEPGPIATEAMEVRLTTWPGGEERLLARVHPHGAFVGWASS